METSKRTKTRGTIVDSNEEEHSEQQSAEVEIPTVEIQPVAKPTKRPATIKTKKKQAITEEYKEKYAFEVINKMKCLYRDDLLLSQQNKPAGNKIENVDEIITKIIKKELQEVLIKMGILKELKIWLEPLPDNSLPNLKIKRTILDALFNIRITKDDLLNSGIGKIVHFYSKNSKEALEIRKKAARLVKKWKGMVIKEETEEL